MTVHVATEDFRGQRLDRFLQVELPGHSRAFLQKLIEQGNVLINGKPGKPSYKVHTGDKISVEIPPPRPLETQPEAIPLDVLYEDDDLIVVNKPAGMVVHPAAGNAEHTLVNALLHHCRGKLAGIGGVQRPGIVHRLDKGTSGCLVVAKTDPAHQSLVAQFKARGVKKIYRAICWGKFTKNSGRIETDIGRSIHDRKKMSTHPATAGRGRAALTEYRVLRQFVGSSSVPTAGAELEQSGGTRSSASDSRRPRRSVALQEPMALVELTLHTGRTHQIRVHMAHIGHPIVGDTTYGRSRSPVTDHRSPFSFARPLLHAYKLGFTHPRTGKFMEFEAPVPEEMRKITGEW
jgi:23S rRNA pseudouridine1911/1915/1917 synthase